MKNSFPTRIALPLLALIISGCASWDSLYSSQRWKWADTVLFNGKIYTGNPDFEWANAIAIKDGVFSYIGDGRSIQSHIGDQTKVINLQGKLAIPGLYDSHIQPVSAAIRDQFEFSFSPDLANSSFLRALEFYDSKTSNKETGDSGHNGPDFFDSADNLDFYDPRYEGLYLYEPEGEIELPDYSDKTRWIVGGSWDFQNFSISGPHRSILDEVVPDRPVALWDVSHRHLWLNTQAMTELFINRYTPDPANGTIVRDKSGEPTGLLLDGAATAISARMPKHDKGHYRQAIKTVSKLMNSYGIIGLTDDLITQEALDSYKRLERFGQMTLQATLAINYSLNEDRLQGAQKRNAEHLIRDVRSDYVKLFIDGTPYERSAALLKPYSDQPSSKGALLFEQAILNRLLIDFDRQGLTVKMHCFGDAAVRSALNAVAAARSTNGDSGLTHQISHIGLVNQRDIPRFRQLGVAAEFSPSIWYPDNIHNQSTKPALGTARTNAQFPIKSLVDSGALVIAGSDWPAGSMSANPWPAIEAMITRANPYNKLPGKLNAKQAIDLKTALDIYTINAARALGYEDRAGSIELGKQANLIVLNQNLFEIPAEQIDKTRVLTTLFQGDVVYQK